MATAWLTKFKTRQRISRTYSALASAGLLLVGILFSLITAGTASAQYAAGINQTINYQGRLLTATGAVVPDGTYNIEFKLYQDGDGTLAGDTAGTTAGSLKWTEDWIYSSGGANDHRVSIKNGYFSVNLGSLTSLASVNFNWDTLWLSANIGNTSTAATFSAASGDGEMLPMKRLASNPYALNSGQLGGLTSSQFVQLGQGIQAATSTTNAAIAINQTGATANILDLQRGGADVQLINNAGQTLFRPTTDSVTALQVQKAGTTTTVFTVDSVNSRIGIGNAAPAWAVDATGSVNASISLKVGGTDVCTGTTCTPASGSANYIQNQNAGAQTSSNFNISGSGTAGSFLTNTIDTPAAGTLSIGTNASSTGLTIGQAGVPVLFPGNINLNSSNTSNNRINIGGTQTSGATSSQYSIQNQLTFAPTANLSNLYSFLNLPVIGTTASNIANVYGQYSRIDTTGGGSPFTGQITTAAALDAGPSSLAGTKPITNYYGLKVDAVTNTGISGNTASNYGVGINLPTGTGTFSTNVGLQIQGTGGASATNYSLYNASTAASYFAGNVGFNNTGATNPVAINSYGTGSFTDAQLYVNANGAANRGIVIQESASPTVNALQVVSSTGSTIAGIRGGGGAFFGTSGAIASNYVVSVSTGTVGNVALGLQSVASQTANIAEFRDANGSTLSAFGSSGQLTLGTATQLGTGSSVVPGVLNLADGSATTSAAGYYGSVQLAGNLTSNQTYSLPVVGGTVCLSTGNCSGSNGYIVNSSTLQPSSTFNISGAGVIGGQGTVGGASNQTQLVVKANSGQTSANPLVVLKNSSGTELARITADSNLNFYAGYNAGQLQTGTSNTGVGYQALGSGSGAGTGNAAFGVTALNSNTSGSSNVAVGNSSLSSNTTGGNNTAAGPSSLSNNTVGAYNTAFGNGAGNRNSSGSYNTYIGTNSGYSDSNVIFYSGAAIQNSTAIGVYSQVQQSNAIVLGSVDTPTNVGIGTTEPANLFSVSPVDLNSTSITASQASGSGAITASAAIFSASNVGETFIWADGTSETVSSFTDSTHITGSSTTITETTKNFRTQRGGFQVTSTGNAFIQNGSTTAFQVQNAIGTSVLNVDTANNITTTKDLNVGNPTSLYGAGRLFSDGFESGNASLWTLGPTTTGSSTLSTDYANPHNGRYAQKVTMSGSGLAYLTTAITPTNTTLSMRGYVYVTSQNGANNLDMMSMVTPSNGAFTLYRDGTTSKLSFANGPAGGALAVGSTVMTTGAWHKIEADITLGTGTTGTVNVFLDNVNVLSQATATTGTNEPTSFRIGDSNAGRQSQFSVDDVVADQIAAGDSSSLSVNDSFHVGGTSSFSGNLLVDPLYNSTLAFQITNNAGVSLLTANTVSNSLSVTGATNITTTSGTGANALSVVTTQTSPTLAGIGVNSSITANPSSAASGINYSAFNGYSYSNSGNASASALYGALVGSEYDGTNQTTSINGSFGFSGFAGTGTANLLQGSSGEVSNNGSGVVTNTNALRALATTNSGGGSITNNYGLYVENQTVATNDYGIYIQGADTYALYVNSGASQFNGIVSVTTNPPDVIGGGAALTLNATSTAISNPSYALNITNIVSPTSASTQNYSAINAYETSSSANASAATLYGIVGNINYTGTNQSNEELGVYGSAQFGGTGISSQAIGISGQVANNSTGTITSAYSVYAANALGSGPITTNYGEFIQNQTAGATNYGLYIQGATTNALYVNSGASQFNGTVGIKTGSTTALTVQNTAGVPIFLVDTSTNLAGNFLTDGGFENGTAGSTPTGWSTVAPSGAVTVVKNVTVPNNYAGQASGLVTTSGAVGQGISTNVFNSTPPASTAFTASFYAQLVSGNTGSSQFSVSFNNGAATACPISTTLVTGGFVRVVCPITSTTAVTSMQIIQNNATASSYYIDGVQLVAGSSATPVTAIGAIQLRGAIDSPVDFQSLSNSSTAFQIQNAAGTSNLFVANTLANSLTLGGSSTTAANINIGNNIGTASVVIDGGPTAVSSISIGTSSTAHNINIGTATAGTQSIQIGGSAASSQTIITGGTGSTAVELYTAAGGSVQVGISSTSIVQLGTSGNLNISTTNNGGGVIIGSGYSSSDSATTPLILDSNATFSEAVNTCSATVNGGALYYNSTTNAIRSCVNANWEDVVTTAGLGLLLYGVVPDSGTNPGDLISVVTPSVSGPCKVSWSGTFTVSVAPCIAYSGGRKVVVASATTVTLDHTVAGEWEHLCFTASGTIPSTLAAGTATETVATNNPTFSVNNPVLCLADIQMNSTTGVLGIYDVRAFTTSTKEVAYATTALTLGGVACINGKAVIPCAATTSSVEGVVVATNLTTSTGAPNVILAASGPTMAKIAVTAGSVVAGDEVQPTATANRTGANVAPVNTATLPFNILGISRSTTPATACTTTANAVDCDYSLYFVQSRSGG